MKIQVTNYTFNPITHEVVFTDYSSIALESVLLVVNVTTNQIIYNFANHLTGGTVTGNKLNLTWDTSTMSATDDLLIYYDAPGLPATDEALILLRRIAQSLIPLATQDINQRQRVTIDAMSGGMTLTTVGNIGAYGGVDPKYQLIDLARNAYANGLRQNLTFS